MTPPEMTDEQIMGVACASPIRDTYWLSPKLETYPDEVREITAFAKAIIAERDKQWAELMKQVVQDAERLKESVSDLRAAAVILKEERDVLSIKADRDKQWTDLLSEDIVTYNVRIAAEMEKLISERDEYQRAADAMAASHKVERDALLDSRHADEALMREALEMCEAVLCNYVCRGTHEETVKHNAAIDAVRARLGTTNATEA